MKQGFKPILYEVVCGYCKNIYNYKYYTNEGDVVSSIEKPMLKKNIITLQSHGICSICEPEVYKQYGMELEYLIIQQKKSKLK